MVIFATMDLTRTAYGTWSGGRYMHFGEALPEVVHAAKVARMRSSWAEKAPISS